MQECLEVTVTLLLCRAYGLYFVGSGSGVEDAGFRVWDLGLRFRLHEGFGLLPARRTKRMELCFRGLGFRGLGFRV